MAQVVMEVVEEEDRRITQEPHSTMPQKPLCKLDALWKEDDARYRGGFVIENEDGSTIFD